MRPPDPEPTPRGHLTEDELLDLVHGDLPGEQRAPLLGHARECGACAASLRDRVADRERARVAFDRHVRRSGQDAAESLPSPSADPVPLRRAGARPAWRPRGWAIAASVVVFAGIMLWRIAEDPVSTLARRRSGTLPAHPEFLTLRRADSTSAADDIRMGIEAYAHGDLVRAHAALSRVPARDPAWPLARLYLASVLLQQGRFEPAAAQLAEVHSRDLPEPWIDQHRWLVVTAALGSHRPERADSVLRLLETAPAPWPARAESLRREWRRTGR